MRFRSVLLVFVVATASIVYAADGAATYKSKCASCHGADGKGQTAVGRRMNLRDLGSPEVQKQTDKELYDWIAAGKGKMPGYKDTLTDVEINVLAAHMRAFAANMKGRIL